MHYFENKIQTELRIDTELRIVNYEGIIFSVIKSGSDEDLLTWTNDGHICGFPKIDLRNCKLSDDNLTDLLKNIPRDILKQLEMINLSCNQLVTPWRAFEGLELDCLKKFYIKNNHIGCAADCFNVFQKHMKNIEKLDLSENHLDACSIELLVKNRLPRLEHLDLHSNPLTSFGLSKLLSPAATIMISKLIDLNLDNCQLDDESLPFLSSFHFEHIGYLNLSRNNFTVNSILKIFYNQSLLDNLISLSLDSCNLDDDFIQILTQLSFPKLSMLSLKNNKITTVGVRYLFAWSLQNISDISIDYSAMGQWTKDELIRAIYSNSRWSLSTIFRLFMSPAYPSLKEVSLAPTTAVDLDNQQLDDENSILLSGQVETVLHNRFASSSYRT